MKYTSVNKVIADSLALIAQDICVMILIFSACGMGEW